MQAAECLNIPLLNLVCLFLSEGFLKTVISHHLLNLR